MINRLLAPPASRNCLDLNALAELAGQPHRLSVGLAEAGRNANAKLAEAFAANTDIAELVQARAWVVEQLVLTAWTALMADSPEMDLVAVGGFGRGEMHPHSDADLLILRPAGSVEDADHPQQMPHSGEHEPGMTPLEHFVRVLWDAGLHPGHGVRSVADCIEQAKSDISVATNLMESRLLHGPGELFAEMHRATGAEAIWPADAFFAAKLAEQQQRHEGFEDTVYNLEPDIKSGPGGLRDIQMISWVTRRHFGTSTLHGLVEHGFLTEREHDQLVGARKRLWKIRWALHQMAGRAEERLLFDYQRKLAAHFGFDQDDGNAAVEAFMQRYYRTVMLIERLNEQLLQMFEEELLAGRKHLPSAEIDDDFRLHHGYLELVDEQAFVRQPDLLLRLFLVLADHPEIRGVRASTIRLVRDHLYLIDEDFRSQPQNLHWFMQLLKKKRRMYSQLERMSRYGVLGALVPGFAQVTGRMQFDLFHVYTVDQHILFVIRNIRRIARGKRPEQFARPIEIFQRIAQPELLYLAALFHDIAKGRGGDHSELGAQDARAMLKHMDIDEKARELVAWLVEQHLLMSMTAQRQDISDPAVVDQFAAEVGTQHRLEYLYVLTAADIAATRPNLWNSWKDSLLWKLFYSTSQRLAEGLDEPIDLAERADRKCAEAQWLLTGSGDPDDFAHERLKLLWDSLPQNALTRMDADQLAWSTGCIARVENVDDHPIAVTRTLEDKQVTELLVYSWDFDGLFAIIAHEFDRMEINVLAARVATSKQGYAWNIFQIIDAQGQPLNPSDAQRLETELHKQLQQRDIRPLSPRPIPRRLRPFIARSEIIFESVRTENTAKTRLEIITTDRPGLLSAIASAMLKANVRLYDARVATFGQRVEDIFLIANRDGSELSDQQCLELESFLRAELDLVVDS